MLSGQDRAGERRDGVDEDAALFLVVGGPAKCVLNFSQNASYNCWESSSQVAGSVNPRVFPGTNSIDGALT